MIELKKDDLVKKLKIGNTLILVFKYEVDNEITFEKIGKAKPIAYYWNSSTQVDRTILNSNFSTETLEMVNSLFKLMKQKYRNQGNDR